MGILLQINNCMHSGVWTKNYCEIFPSNSLNQQNYSTGITPNLRLHVKQMCYETADLALIAKQNI